VFIVAFVLAKADLTGRAECVRDIGPCLLAETDEQPPVPSVQVAMTRLCRTFALVPA